MPSRSKSARLSTVLLAALISGCAAQRSPHLLLSAASSTTVADLAHHYPLAPEQTIQIERLAITDETSTHFVQVRPGGGELPHVHLRHDLVVIVLAGAGTQRIGKQAFALRAGDAATIPAGTLHYFVNDCDVPTAALVVFSPPYDGSDQVHRDP